MDVNVEKEIEILCIDLVREYPFYGYIMMQMPKIYINNDDKTLGVGKDIDDILLKLYIWKGYVENMYAPIDKANRRKADNHFLEVLKHEILHICFYHLSINLEDKHRQTIATECEVNSYLDRNKLLPNPDGTPGGVFPSDFDLETKQSALWYYDKLKDNKKYQDLRKQEQEMINNAIKAAAGCGGGKPGEGDGDGKGKITGKTLDCHDKWQGLKDDPAIKEIIKDLIRKSDDLCRNNDNWGSLPAGLLDELRKSLEKSKPVIPWQRILKTFISSSSESVLNLTLRKKSKRFGTRPGLYKEDTLRLAVGIDTSGSVNTHQLKIFFNELHWMAKDPNVIITIFECDCEIHRVYPFRQYDGNISGRGGTDLEPVLKRVCDEKYDALVYFTDFCAPQIEKKYPIPVLWCISGGSGYFERPEDRCYKYGIFLNMDLAIPPYPDRNEDY